jgi:hypothetical protein
MNVCRRPNSCSGETHDKPACNRYLAVEDSPSKDKGTSNFAQSCFTNLSTSLEAYADRKKLSKDYEGTRYELKVVVAEPKPWPRQGDHDELGRSSIKTHDTSTNNWS